MENWDKLVFKQSQQRGVEAEYSSTQMQSPPNNHWLKPATQQAEQ